MSTFAPSHDCVDVKSATVLYDRDWKGSDSNFGICCLNYFILFVFAVIFIEKRWVLFALSMNYL